ncbi:ABC transporter ATP-binding protein [Nocardioides pantholopis]|uniref:ABC transporter ATP-binding protein n=1 Tax=Nocardioides pantholopis TaxID=2483798 RepID=UPI000F081C75|nr:ABC transporter ATP-binding protein [Nocardioides pantholopis]
MSIRTEDVPVGDVDPRRRPPAVRLRGLAIETDDPHSAPGASLPLVRDVSFDVGAGEMVGLVGESGSGKSLTASAVASLLPAGVRRSAGVVEVGGVRVEAHVRHPDVAMIFQNPMTSLNPSMRIGDQIAETVRLRHRGTSRQDARRRAVDILDQVEVTRPAERARQYPFEFSGGMRQRAMIGIAIARDPAVLIADEPTTALDVTVQRGVMDLVDRLRRDMGLAVLLISHDLGVVSERCDRLLVMYSGELVEVGATRDVLDAPLHPYLDGLIRCIPEHALISGRLEPLPGQVPAPEDVVTGCRFADRCHLVLPACREAAVPLETASVGRDVRCIRWPERVAGFADEERVTP